MKTSPAAREVIFRLFETLDDVVRERVMQTIGGFDMFVNQFDPNSERERSLINVKDSLEYRNFISGICKKLKLKKYCAGDIICHKGDLGEEMYFIHEGKVTVYIEQKYSDVEAQTEKLEYLYNLISSSSKSKYDESTIIKDFPPK
jgi:hypothetical protein